MTIIFIFVMTINLRFDVDLIKAYSVRIYDFGMNIDSFSNERSKVTAFQNKTSNILSILII